MVARSKARVCGRSLAGIVGSNPTGGMDVFLLRVLCVVSLRQADHFVQWRPTECGVSECDHESSTMRRPWPTGAVASW